VSGSREAADEAVRSELPEIPNAAPRRTWLAQQPVFIGVARLLRGDPLDEAVDLRDREARHTDVEVEVLGDQALKLAGKDLLVPSGVERELVVGKHVGPLLGGAHCLNASAGNGVESQVRGGGHTPVAGENHVGLVDQHGVREPEPPDGVGNLSDLPLGMRSRVSRVRLKSRG
jgi:hypothetical protein